MPLKPFVFISRHKLYLVVISSNFKYIEKEAVYFITTSVVKESGIAYYAEKGKRLPDIVQRWKISNKTAQAGGLRQLRAATLARSLQFRIH